MLPHIWGVPNTNNIESCISYADLTVKQAFGLGVIRTLIGRGYPPTLSEIASNLGIKRHTAMQLLAILERKGYLLRNPGVVRSLRLTNKPLPYATQRKAA